MLRILWVMLLMFVLFLGGLMGAIFLNKGKIKQVIVEEINDYLLIPVDVGNIKLGFWQHFPYISVDFSQVETRETPRIPGQAVLLKADHIYLKMHPLDLIRKNYRIRRISIEKAELNLLLFQDGNDNYHVFKSREADSLGELNIHLDAVGLHHVDFRFRDLATDQDYNFLLQQMDLRGLLSGDLFDAFLTAKIEAKMIRTGGSVILENRMAELSTSLKVDAGTGRIYLHSGKIKTPAMTIHAEGMIKPGVVSDSLDIVIHAGAARVSDLIELLPEQVKAFALSHKSTGNLSYHLTINGLIGAGTFPSIKADWQLDNGALLVCEHSRLWIKNFKAAGHYDNSSSPSLDKHSMEISQISFNLGGHPVKASLTFSGLDAPKAHGRIQASMELEKVLACVGKDWPFNLKGKADFDGQFAFQLEEGWRMVANWSDAIHVDAKGALHSAQLSYPDAALKLQNLSGGIRLKDGDLFLQGIEAKTPEGPINLDVRFAGFLPWLEDKRYKAYADITLHATELPLEKWFPEETKNTESAFSLGGIEADFNVVLDKVSYRGFKASQLEGDVSYSPAGLTARNLFLQTMQGTLSLKGSLITTAEGHRINCMAKLKDINITDLFSQLNNFGQEEITHKHLQGLLTADVELSMELNKAFYPLEPSIKAMANVSIRDGVLKDYEPLKGLARFIKAGNLDRVSVAPLHNQIFVRDSRILIPEMTVNTDAINVTLSGTHHFDQRVDYSFQVLLSEILGRKAREARKENAEFGVVVDDGLGKTMLFIRMTGTSDKPVFSYDRRGLMQKVGKDLEAERKEVRQVLREEFQWLRQDSVKRENRRAEKRRLKEQEKGEFIYEWEDE